jgi:phosphorylcholine metabolism protein LicD
MALSHQFVGKHENNKTRSDGEETLDQYHQNVNQFDCRTQCEPKHYTLCANLYIHFSFY